MCEHNLHRGAGARIVEPDDASTIGRVDGARIVEPDDASTNDVQTVAENAAAASTANTID